MRLISRLFSTALIAALTSTSSLYAQGDYSTPYTVSTFAGSTSSGAVDAVGSTARFNGPSALAKDLAGNLYVADSANHSIRRIASTAAVSTLNDPVNPTRFGALAGIAVDESGNVFVSDYTYHIIWKLSASGVVTQYAGTVVAHGGAIDGPVNQALFNVPQGLAADKSGNLYVADYVNHTIRKVSPGGLVSTFAGSAGQIGSVDGARADARFRYPRGVAVDGAGNVYVADAGNATIRKISTSGLVTTLAGTAGQTGTTDGAGSAARFNNPGNISVDAAGTLYVTDMVNNRIRKVTAEGNVTTIAGELVGSADGVGSAAQFNTPVGIVVDDFGTVFVADTNNNLIRKVAPNAPVIASLPLSRTVATTYPVTFSVNAGGNPAPTFQWQKDGVNLSGATGSTYTISSAILADAGNYRVSVSNSAGTVLSPTANLEVEPALTVTTFAGSSTSLGTSDGTGPAAQFDAPYDVALDPAGNLYVTDPYRSTVRKITPAGVVTTLAGLADVSGSVDGVGSAARFSSPYGIAVGADGSIYVASAETVRKISAGGAVTTLAGSAGVFGSADGIGSAALFNAAWDVAVDNASNVYVADRSNSTIRKISSAGLVTTLAGSPGVTGAVDGTGSAARFDNPIGLTIDAEGNILVADGGNNLIRKVTPAGLVTTVAGIAGVSDWADGPVQTATFSYPSGLATDEVGNLYVTEMGGTIRKISPTGLVTTIAGRPGDARGATDGTGFAAHFYYPSGIAINPAGQIYLTDTGNHTVRRATLLQPVPIIVSQPASQSIATGLPVTFSVSASGSGITYQWRKNGAAIAGATGSSYSLSSVSLSDAGAYVVDVSNSAGSVSSAPATLSVFPRVDSHGNAADFNADGKPDLIWSNSKTGERALWLMNGTNFLAASTLGIFPLEWTIAATGDFNADGKPDLVWSNSLTGERALWLMNGTNLLGVSTLGTFPLEWTVAATADFNADGKPDIIWSNSITGERAIWLMNGTNFLGASTLGTFPLEWTVAATGDFNADGKPDLVWSNSLTGERALWLMDGTTRIGVSTLGLFPLEWTVAGTADFNADGKPDIIWSNSITGERALWLMNGTNFLSASTLGIFPLEWTVSN